MVYLENQTIARTPGLFFNETNLNFRPISYSSAAWSALEIFSPKDILTGWVQCLKNFAM